MGPGLRSGKGQPCFRRGRALASAPAIRLPPVPTFELAAASREGVGTPWVGPREAGGARVPEAPRGDHRPTTSAPRAPGAPPAPGPQGQFGGARPRRRHELAVLDEGVTSPLHGVSWAPRWGQPAPAAALAVTTPPAPPTLPPVSWRVAVWLPPRRTPLWTAGHRGLPSRLLLPAPRSPGQCLPLPEAQLHSPGSARSFSLPQLGRTLTSDTKVVM